MEYNALCYTESRLTFRRHWGVLTGLFCNPENEACSSETPVDFQMTIRCYTSKDIATVTYKVFGSYIKEQIHNCSYCISKLSLVCVCFGSEKGGTISCIYIQH